MKKRFYTLAFVLTAVVAVGQNSVKGYVFVDKNQNGKKERKEEVLSGVSVSNGVDVVQTDHKGFYELPLTGDNQIFVIKPSQYTTAVDQYNLPKTYVTHKPKGSPKGTQYEGVAPTGKLPKEVNFAMIAQEESAEFKAFIFGDPQPYSLQELDYFKKAIVDEVKHKTKGISFGISLGDLVGDKLDLHTPYKDVMKQVGLPWYNVMGNHDMNYEATEDIYSDETFEKNFGPANYAFNYGEAHFIVLDDILYPHPIKKKGYLGGFRKDQIAFVKNNLKYVDKDKLVVISLHIPLFIGGEKHFDQESRQELLDVLSGHENILVLSAHTHYQMHQFYTKEHGWSGVKPIHEYNVGTTSGDWYSGEFNELGVPASTMRDGTPRGYATLVVKGNEYALDYKVSGESEDYKMELFMPKVMADKRAGNYRVYANVFMGTERDQVEYRVNEGQWKKMNKENGVDPAFYAEVQKYDLTDELLGGRKPSNPINSSHLWSAKLPFNIGVGEHTVEVRVKDMFGREYTEKKTYRIEKSKY
ncbi:MULTISPECIES: calcineurin-like phosphoesterase C-terminal domain-containing protein [Myroides]|uniref:Metallophosphoesterase n=1 Tax=Myroides albus TaxID=2562892 RepID=A0A6I3LK38_9FLAO|nr:MULTISPECIES: calcineurin-like phosphoesterase family protein [Myroides]MTG98174.1 metallophosphoesterase [Myroides albus]MVX34376.1 metallophosphoesterase [Myroides sp. LoEW2-1]